MPTDEVSAVFSAANLKSGGAVQVASSVFSELTRREQERAFPWLADSVFLASPEVASNLSDEVLADPRVTVLEAGRRRPQLPLAPDAVWFDVFGGAVQRPVPVPRLVGFADGTAIYPHPCPRGLQRLKLAVRSRISRASFRRADRLVVETEAVRDRLVTHGFDRSRIDVVWNSYHPVFDQPLDQLAVDEWGKRLTEVAGYLPRLLYVSRGYPHKNHGFIGAVAREFERAGEEPPAFVLTLTPEEFASLDPDTRRVSVNVGPVPVHDLPALYRSVDACFFPSLLEIFSATPLEALRSAVPLVAVDREYVTSIVGTRGFFYAQEDAAMAAARIREALSSSTTPTAEWQEWATSLDGSAQRAAAYARIMESMRPRGTSK